MFDVLMFPSHSFNVSFDVRRNVFPHPLELIVLWLRQLGPTFDIPHVIFYTRRNVVSVSRQIEFSIQIDLAFQCELITLH